MQRRVADSIKSLSDVPASLKNKAIDNQDSLMISVHANIDSPGDTSAKGTPTRMLGTLSGIMIIDKNTGMVLQKQFITHASGTNTLNQKAVETNSISAMDDRIIVISAKGK